MNWLGWMNALGYAVLGAATMTGVALVVSAGSPQSLLGAAVLGGVPAGIWRAVYLRRRIRRLLDQMAWLAERRRRSP